MKTMNGILHGDFGESIVFPGQTVGSILKEKLPASARLGIQEVIVGLSLGIILGILAAMNRGTWIDRTIVTIAILFYICSKFHFLL